MCDQVLFAPGGSIQETGASNFVVIDDTAIITPAKGSALLNGGAAGWCEAGRHRFRR